MIRITISDRGLRLDGHANCKNEHGNDLACAAVSALTVTLAMGLTNIAGEDVNVLLDPGQTVIDWQKLSDTGKALVDTWFLGIEAINEQYKCITVNTDP